MTNERAIELLNRISDSQFDGPHGDERREALSMAVRALESNLVKESDGLVKDLVEDSSSDLISRQAVMKEFSDFVRKSNNSDFAPTPTWNDAVSLVGSIPSVQPVNYGSTKSDSSSQLKLNNDLISRQDVLKILSSKNAAWDAYDKVKRLPSAQPHWNPCSERMPEANGRYLVTRGLNACGAMWNRVYIINYSDLMGLKSERIWWGGNVGKSDFERFDDVIAWMPLPKPYGGEGE